MRLLCTSIEPYTLVTLYLSLLVNAEILTNAIYAASTETVPVRWLRRSEASNPLAQILTSQCLPPIERRRRRQIP